MAIMDDQNEAKSKEKEETELNKVNDNNKVLLDQIYTMLKSERDHFDSRISEINDHLADQKTYFTSLVSSQINELDNKLCTKIRVIQDNTNEVGQTASDAYDASFKNSEALSQINIKVGEVNKNTAELAHNNAVLSKKLAEMTEENKLMESRLDDSIYRQM